MMIFNFLIDLSLVDCIYEKFECTRYGEKYKIFILHFFNLKLFMKILFCINIRDHYKY